MKLDLLNPAYAGPPVAVVEPATQGECSPPHEGASDDALDRTAQAALAIATSGLSPASACLAWLDWGLHLAASPGKCLTLAMEAGRALPGSIPVGSAGTPTHEPQPATVVDPRFADPSWQRWPFRAYRDTFLRLEAWGQHATTGVRGVEAHHEQLVQFFARQWADAFSPSNFVLTNPLVFETAFKTSGANFVTGAQHWADDLQDVMSRLKGGRPRRQQSFMPGCEVAITPGQVVWRNSLCELLQYAPATTRVAREPVFIVPSWIMKYYILDLQPHNSLVRYLVKEGYTVFVLSWHNPSADEFNLRLNDYLSEGVFAALAEVRARCANQPVHAVGYCLGGTLVTMAAAALARDGRANELHTVTLLAAQTDFSEPGELGLFIDASELAALDALMWQQGFLDGSQMAAAFQLLNARDLIWSRMMSEYLLGRRSKPNDLMSWNADTTRMPYRMHSEYLRQLFLDNDFAHGRYCVAGRPVAPSDIETPMFVVATERDHVSPWRSVYKINLLTHNALTFLLTSGGHNAGIVSELGHVGRHYRCATRAAGMPYRSWHAFFEGTRPVDGSWWPCWSQWLCEQSSGQVHARVVADGLTKAPGTYVFES
jgi:polyhydroxyalkanoate synthase